MTFRRRCLLLILPLIGCLALFLFLVFERVRGKAELARSRQELAAKGYKLTASDLANRPVQGPNGAEFLRSARFDAEGGNSYVFPGCRTLTESGNAIACFRRSEWKEGTETFTWTNVAQTLQSDAAALEKVRDTLTNRVFDNQMDYSAGLKIDLSHLAACKLPARNLGASAQLSLHRGQTPEATKDLVAMVRLLRMVESDKLFISELVRIAIAAMASAYTWEALQAEPWQDKDLAELANAWTEPGFIANMESSIEGEILLVDSAFKILRQSNDAAAEYLYWDKDIAAIDSDSSEKGLGLPILYRSAAKMLRKQVLCRIWRFAWLDHAEAWDLHNFKRLGEIMQQAKLHRNMSELEADTASLLREAEPKSAYGRLRIMRDSDLAISANSVTKAMRSETDQEMVLTAIALKRYYLRNHQYPESLAALVPELLPAMPIDYMDGKPLKYKRDHDGAFTLYSSGSDKADDGGDSSVVQNRSSGPMWNRLDAVWPKEASSEEALMHDKSLRQE